MRIQLASIKLDIAKLESITFPTNFFEKTIVFVKVFIVVLKNELVNKYFKWSSFTF